MMTRPEPQKIRLSDLRHDDRPMVDIHLNGIELARKYAHVPTPRKGAAKPWAAGLEVWWKFMRDRDARRLAREARELLDRGRNYREEDSAGQSDQR